MLKWGDRTDANFSGMGVTFFESFKSYISRARILTEEGSKALRVRGEAVADRTGLKYGERFRSYVRDLSEDEQFFLNCGLRYNDTNIGRVLMDALVLKFIDDNPRR